jgi:hypothetical protein
LRIFGVDFTSAPSHRKPIVQAIGELSRQSLAVTELRSIHTLSGFDCVLRTPGPWVGGFDFPFGLPRKLLNGVELPDDWAGYVAAIESMGKPAFCALLEQYKEDRAPGDREHLRVTDRQAGALSPQKLYGTPLAKMFFEGAIRLRQAPVDVPPLRRRVGSPVALEAYPALVARGWIGRASYKTETRAKQTPEQADVRARIVRTLTSSACRKAYGFRVSLPSELADRMVKDAGGDHLDAVLCAVQAAGAFQRGPSFGIPLHADPVEGWIVDPGLDGRDATAVVAGRGPKPRHTQKIPER